MYSIQTFQIILKNGYLFTELSVSSIHCKFIGSWKYCILLRCSSANWKVLSNFRITDKLYIFYEKSGKYLSTYGFFLCLFSNITHYCVRIFFCICISLKLFLSVRFSNIYTCLYLSHIVHVLVMIDYFSDEITDYINKSPEKNKTLTFLKLFELSVMRIKL